MQWFKLPPKKKKKKNSLQYLQKMESVERVMLVCDPGMVQCGYADIVRKELQKRKNDVKIEVFSDVEPNPSTNTVYAGTKMMVDFQPDTVIALGGGSAMDAAKGMWMFYEHPDTEFFGAKQKFLDIRKRTYKIAKPEKTQFICIPTTSGTGSEVTPFAVITDSETHVKYPLADYALTPDVAIVDPQFVMSVPASVTADTGMDVLTHAIESYVSVMASDYTRGLSLQAIKLVFDHLENSVKRPDMESREKMHNASCIAGMAFTNASIGITHSLAHALGGVFHVPHGRANALLMTHVIAFNANLHGDCNSEAAKRYAYLAQSLGLPAQTVKEGVISLIVAINVLKDEMGMPKSIRDTGVSEADFYARLTEMVGQALRDSCTPTNPRDVNTHQLETLYRQAFAGVSHS